MALPGSCALDLRVVLRVVGDGCEVQQTGEDLAFRRRPHPAVGRQLAAGRRSVRWREPDLVGPCIETEAGVDVEITPVQLPQRVLAVAGTSGEADRGAVSTGAALSVQDDRRRTARRAASVHPTEASPGCGPASRPDRWRRAGRRAPGDASPLRCGSTPHRQCGDDDDERAASTPRLKPSRVSSARSGGRPASSRHRRSRVQGPVRRVLRGAMGGGARGCRDRDGVPRRAAGPRERCRPRPVGQAGGVRRARRAPG